MRFGVFCREIKDAQRAHKNTSLTNNAKVYRRKTNDISHDETCVLVHFLPEIKQHTTEVDFQDLANRLSKSYLDSELHEKAKTMDDKLTVWDFRFVTMIIGKEVVKVQCLTPLEQQAQECEIAVFFERLTAEVMVWLDYRCALQAWESNGRVAKRREDKTQEADIIEVVEAFCSTWSHIAKESEDAVIPFVCESITIGVEKASLSNENIYAVFIVRYDVLGQKLHTNMLPTL